MKALLKLKLRLMKESKWLYIIMIAMSFVLAGIFGGSMNGNFTASIAVVDEDLSVEASTIISKLTSDYNYKVLLVTEDEASEMVMDREIIASIVLHEDFYKSENGIEILQIKESVESSQLSRVLEAEVALIEHTNELSGKIASLITPSHPNLDTSELNYKVQKVFIDQWADKKPITTTTQILDEVDALSKGMNVHYIVGMTLFFVTYSLMFTVGDILEDKRLHTMDRILVSPATRRDLLTANLIGTMIIGIIQIIVMILAGQYMFGIEWGNNLPLVIGIGSLYIFTMTTLSLFVVSLVKTTAQLGSIAPIVLTGMGMLGGCMWPLEIITSKPLLMLANITPHKWAFGAIKGAIVYGRVDGTTLTAVLVLALMGLLYLVLGERVMYLKAKHEN